LWNVSDSEVFLLGVADCPFLCGFEVCEVESIVLFSNSRSNKDMQYK